MKNANDLIPWKVTDISLRPYKEMWSFNPSIHFDGQLWRCVLRCCDYAMPAGVTIRSGRARSGESRTKNAMVIFDPVSWKPVEIYKMRERDDLPRVSSGSVGYEDIRIFRTDKDGLQGIAAALHLRKSDRRDQAEQVLLWFDERYDIVDARPIRGSFCSSPQKNWVPFDHCAEPRFLYSIDNGSLFDARGELTVGQALVQPSSRDRTRSYRPDERARERAGERAQEIEQERSREERRRQQQRDQRGGDTTSRRDAPSTVTYEGLRGGTQLVRVGDDAWLGIGHAMKFVDGLKYYWHVWYRVDSRGKLTAASAPMKLAPNGIEFAAGMAIDGDRVVVSFGVDDMECRLGETKLSAVMAMLQPVKQAVL